MTARVRRIDGPTYGDLLRESPTAIAPDMWGARPTITVWPIGGPLAPREYRMRARDYRIPASPASLWATMYVRPTREVE